MEVIADTDKGRFQGAGHGRLLESIRNFLILLSVLEGDRMNSRLLAPQKSHSHSKQFSNLLRNDLALFGGLEHQGGSGSIRGDLYPGIKRFHMRHEKVEFPCESSERSRLRTLCILRVELEEVGKD